MTRPDRTGSTMVRRSWLIAAGVLLTAVVLSGQDRAPQSDEPFRFRSGVELINVTATVLDSSGRFVPGLSKDDFRVFEDNEPQTITHFSAERVPVSLGIVLDTSGSMAGEKIHAARRALDRFLYDLLSPEDEIFLYGFSNEPVLLQGWTTNRQTLSRALNRIVPEGGTAMYDAVAEALPLAQSGMHRKKALLVVSDGNDTSSQATSIVALERQIRESEVLVYAIGIDGDSPTTVRRSPLPPRTWPPFPMPFPRPGRGGWPRPGPPAGGSGSPGREARVNTNALRDITDDSGGRTEIIREARDLDPATAGIAEELSQQYFLGYPASGKKDGRWHTIRVEVPKGAYKVRARRGYTAS
jgi:Ca-activated chloride channel family protein